MCDPCELPRRVAHQPSPSIFPGGDCGACCIAGALDIPCEQAYELQDKCERPKDAQGKPVPFGWHGMAWALKNGSWNGRSLTDSVVDSVPIWPEWFREQGMTMGMPGWQMSLAWWNYVRMGLLGGFYGICQVNMNGDGPLSIHDHWVMVCGAKQEEVPVASMPGASRIDLKILVSCSAKNRPGKWMDAEKFLQDHGGFNVIMVRPRT